ncbi:MAG: ribonuclease P protein component [Firmicutes bacterium]|nr:ribonuclease P protein component [Bacillota bacterium]
MLPKQNRLTKRKEFGYIYKNGKAVHSNMFSVISVKSYQTETRIGFSVSNKLGNAPARNRIKRRLREIMKYKLSKLNTHQNLIIIAKQPAAEADFNKLKSEIDYILKKGSYLKNE